MTEQDLVYEKLEEEWKVALAPILHTPIMQSLQDFLAVEKKAGKVIYPPEQEVFQAFTMTPLSQVKVVVLGQDPYHGVNQAHGLCFSVRHGTPLPPSLKNIYREIQSDIGIEHSKQGELTYWAKQGVFLLNSVLTVEAGLAASHKKQGWEDFTDEVIAVLNQQCEHLVFLLWGSYAQKKGRMIDTSRHLVLQAAHPSPLSANRGGWFGCRHFSKTNHYLEANGKTPIDWSLPG